MATLPVDRIGVCSWSLHPESPAELLDRLKAVGLSRVQLYLNPLRTAPAVWGAFRELARRNGVTIVSGMYGAKGEDYSTLESIRRTGGVVPDETWEENWRDLTATIELAHQFGLGLVTLHAGFLPSNPADPALAKLIARIRQITDGFAAAGMAVAFETGQETAATLRDFLERVDRPNLGVNFDPANMILYGQGDPIAALRELAPWIRQIHIKDAVRTAVPGTWGREVPVGTGDVDWPAFFRTLREVPRAVELVIEREAGENRVAEIIAARRLVEAALHT
jgi:sugar phosphate isomerase/epimerase